MSGVGSVKMMRIVESVFTIMILLGLLVTAKSEVYIVTIEGEPVISYKGDVNGFEATVVESDEKLDVTRVEAKFEEFKDRDPSCLSYCSALLYLKAAQLQPKATTTPHRLPPPIPHHTTTKQSPEFSNSGSHHSQHPPVAADKPTEDGYNWRKYGQKQVKGSEYPRSYYKCTHQNCPVKKKVERNLDGLVTEIIYKGEHNHQPPRSGYGGVGTSGQLQLENFEGQSGNFNHSRVDASSIVKDDQLSGSSDGEKGGDDVTVPRSKRRNVEVKAFDPISSHRTVTEPRIVVQATSEIDLFDDGYKWRKYWQKVVKGNRHPRHVLFS
ncbi:hypothetical protein L6452_31458 [Arctium lappa]|uniref:Uncharacterized protein n=1 Tax=Arctium lappa TaxID=4217 RepID=A0ACB8Z126_ARCLA|nr:hypothetical protein L6452_31458 [Arctium lappa]